AETVDEMRTSSITRDQNRVHEPIKTVSRYDAIQCDGVGEVDTVNTVPDMNPSL
ncbi:hypothetical protein A2U01_0055302, partial [Trifolium medium]|nr:hypothetical protein [Trifolium medium]